MSIHCPREGCAPWSSPPLFPYRLSLWLTCPGSTTAHLEQDFEGDTLGFCLTTSFLGNELNYFSQHPPTLGCPGAGQASLAKPSVTRVFPGATAPLPSTGWEQSSSGGTGGPGSLNQADLKVPGVQVQGSKAAKLLPGPLHGREQLRKLS